LNFHEFQKVIFGETVLVLLRTMLTIVTHFSTLSLEGVICMDHWLFDEWLLLQLC
jgi:hypothetical protein